MRTSSVISVTLLMVCTSLSLANTSCTCQKAMPQFVQAQSIITDAEQALRQAKSLMDIAVGVPDSVREGFDTQMEKAMVGLRLASKGLVVATQTCSATDMVSVFKEFNAAWDIIRELIPLIASYSKAGKAKVGVSVSSHVAIVADPICYSIR